MAEPGFKEVKGGRISFGSIPEDWEVDKLINVCLEKPEYGAGESAIEYTEGMVRYVRITDIKEDGILKDEKAGITDEAAEQYLLSEGDFLFARSGSVGRTYRYEKKDGSCAFAGYLIRFKTDLSKIRIEYLKGYCQSHMYRCWVNYISRVTSQPNINAKEYSSLPIPLPSLSEQDRILRFLSRVDSGIEKAGRLITEHRELKRGMMQKLFTEGIGHTEFKDTKIGRIPVAWEISRLGKLGIFFKGKTLKKNINY